MPIRISFDGSRSPEQPTLVLATKDGTKLGALNTVTDVTITDSFNSVCELSFTLHKQFDGVECHLWDDVTNFKLLWCKEWDRWFSIEIKVTESDSVTKNIVASSLGEYELSQILLFDIEINTESDILRDDYEPSVLYSSDKNKSILNRILEKAPHYSVAHVDSTIAGIQRTFSFDGKSIVDCLSEVAEEVGCVVVHDANTKDGAPARTISVYDVEDSCLSCGYRGVIGDACQECGGANIVRGYGEDTNVFVSTDNLTDEVTFETDVDSVKNCFRLNAGDDMMTAVVRACTPTGSNYIWYISDELKGDMSPALRDALDRYDSRYEYHNSTAEYSIDSELLTRYNTLVSTYGRPSGAFSALPSKIVGFPALMNAYFDVLDFGMYMKTSMMPPVPIPDTSAASMITKLTQANLSPASITSLSASTSKSTIESAIKNISKTYIGSSLFDITVKTSSWANPTWRGKIEITSKTDTADTAETNEIQISFTSDYATYLRQSIGKRVSESDTDDLSISGTLGLSGSELADRLKQYSYDCLMEIDSCCEAVLNILIETNASNVGSDLYNSLYLPYYNKRRVIQSELSLRQVEVESIIGTMSDTGDYTGGIQQAIESIRNGVQVELNMEAFLGQQLWLELNMFRREDEYTNDNYISDGLSNAELIQMAKEFIERANRELYKSATAQHSISSTLKNLLLIPAFEPIIDKFSVGNWVRVRVDDEVYKLRLVRYELSYSQPEELQVEFSDVVSIKDGISDISSILSRASSMATSYNYISTQAGNGNAAASILNNWFENGLSVSNARIVESADNQNMVWDEHGMVFRRKDPITDLYDPTQLKIVNSTIAVTDDEWRTTKTAIGRFFYINPDTGAVTEAYGVNAETIVGNLILGRNLRLSNQSSSMTFNEDGLSVSNGVNSIAINPNSDRLFEISNSNGDGLLFVDEHGGLHIDMSGVDGSAIDISTNQSITNVSQLITQNNTQISSEIETMKSQIEESVSGSVKRITPYYALGGSPTTPPPPPTGLDAVVGEKTKAIAGIAIVGLSVVGDGVGEDGTWTINQPVAVDGSYAWTCFLVEYLDGTTSWTDPTLITDSVVRKQVRDFGSQLEVVDTAIKQKVWMTDIQTAKSALSGEITEVRSLYSQTVQDISGIRTEVANLETSISDTESSLNNKITDVETTASGISTTVTQLSERITNDYSTTSSVQSMIKQSADSIEVRVQDAEQAATQAAADAKSYTDSQFTIASGLISSKVSASDYTGAQIVSMINQTANSVTINANHIKLEGIVTANENFKILSDGSVETIGGKIGGFTITSSYLRKELLLDDTRYQFVVQAANGDTTTNVFFVRTSADNGETWDYPFRVNYRGDTYARKVYCASIGEYQGDGLVRISNSMIAAPIVTDGSYNGVSKFCADEFRVYYSDALASFVIRSSTPTTNTAGGGVLGASSYPFDAIYTKSLLVNGSSVVSDKKQKNHVFSLRGDLTPLNEEVAVGQRYDIAEEIIMNLHPSAYTLKSAALDNNIHFGFYAQDVYSLLNDICPNYSLGMTSAITEPEDGVDKEYDLSSGTMPDEKIKWALSYHEIIAPLVAVVQKQQAELSALKEYIMNL